jgi:uncharacterized protein (DUF58 family)
MIAPSTRMLIWSGAVVLPAALIAAMSPALSPVAVGAAALFAAIAVLDAALGLSGLQGIEVLLPAVVRLSKDRDGAIDIQIKNDRQKSRQVRLGIALPREFSAPQEDVRVQLPPQSLWSRLAWPCTPLRRGTYSLDRCHLETASPLGLWAVRHAAAIRSEVRVYPNLLKERNAAAAIFLNRGMFGLHNQRQIGKARDFEHLREYVAGDSYDDIHWKATAKRNHPVTKIYQIERTQEIYVVIDASRLSARVAPDGSTLLERFITAGLVLGMAAEQQGDLFGLITFSDRIEKFVRAKGGQSHYNACRDAIYALHPRQVTPDFGELAGFIRMRLRRRALLVFLTSLDDPVLSENFIHDVELICRQHVILVNMMRNPEINPMFSGPPAAGMDDLYQRLGGHIQWNNLRELEKKLKRRGVQFSLVDNERLGAQLITQYLSIKQRQVI